MEYAQYDGWANSPFVQERVKRGQQGGDPPEIPDVKRIVSVVYRAGPNDNNYA
jgi:hypothetical protein